MPSIEFGISSEERARGDLPELPVINMFAETAPTEEKGVVLQSRPGLADRSADMGDGPVEALFQRDGVLAGALFGVSGGQFYEGTDAIGSIAGDDPVSIAGNDVGVMVAAGGNLSFYDGAALTTVALPDGWAAAKVFNGASRFFVIAADTGRVYWTDPLEDDFAGPDDGLDFATAESAPDALLDGLWLDDTAILFGAETVEFWPNTNDDPPIQPLEGRVFEKGVRATGCAAVFDATFAWVGNDNVVYMPSGSRPEAISNPGLEEKIAASYACRLWTFPVDGQEFLALRLDAATYVFGARNRRWSQFASYGWGNWIPQCHAGGVFGSAVDGRTAAWHSGYTDFGGVMERTFRAGFALNSGGQKIHNLGLRSQVGQTPYLSGDYAEPEVELFVSPDAGRTWGPGKPRSLGREGEYRKRVRWNSLGMASQPGFLAEFRLTAPVSWRVSDVLVNEARGGR